MITRRIAPCLLLSGRKLVKTVKYDSPKYVGDPINAVKIFNDKEVDEILILDIEASVKGQKPQFDYLQEVVSEAFVPISYGGGISSLEDVDKLLQMGIEKICLHSVNSQSFELIKLASAKYGAQSVVGMVDVKKSFFGKNEVYYKNHKLKTRLNLIDYIKEMQEAGAGEIGINFVDRDGTYKGFDNQLISEISSQLSVPLIVVGGAGNYEHLSEAFKSGASAVCAGSLFVFHGPHKAVLISYPDVNTVENIKFEKKLS